MLIVRSSSNCTIKPVNHFLQTRCCCLNSSVALNLLELTCPLDSEYRIEAARSREQNKTEYLQLFDHLKIDNYYETVERARTLSAQFHPECLKFC